MNTNSFMVRFIVWVAIVSLSPDWCLLRRIFDLSNSKKFEGAFSDCTKVWSLKTSDLLRTAAQDLINALVNYSGEDASQRFTNNVTHFFQIHHIISSEVWSNIRCWSSDLWVPTSGAQHVHIRRKQSTLTWYNFYCVDCCSISTS